jgi:hypothetical protein
MDHRPKLFLVAAGGRLTGGYKSGRNSERDTPETSSTASTRSAGTRPRFTQPEMEPCDLSRRACASAICPPTALQASSNASLLMYAISAETVNGVNAYSAKAVRHHHGVGKQSECDPSPFWQRLEEAWKPKGLPVSQNGVADLLDMSQGSTRRWYLGDGLPETKTLIDIAQRGDVTVDWLLTGRLPKHPIDPATQLGAIHASWSRLDDAGRQHLFDALNGRKAVLGLLDTAPAGKGRQIK